MGLLGRFINSASRSISNSSNNFLTKNEFSVHPDLIDLIWIGDGKHQNFQNQPRSSEVYNFDGFSVKISMFGPDEPSLLYLSPPIRRPSNPDLVERPPYYPSYNELTPEQKWMYWRFLSDPYNPNNDIGYVFIFYYGLERHLLHGNFDSAFDVILKLRNIYSNKSFQMYSSSALILSAMLHKRPDCAEKFIESLDREYEFQIPDGLYMLCKFGLNMPITPRDVMCFYKDFGFTNNRYIKSNPDLFLDCLTSNIRTATGGSECIYANQYFSKMDVSHMPIVRMRIFANVSIIEKEIAVPDITRSSKFTGTVYKILTKTHEDTKAELARIRKKTNNSSKEEQKTKEQDKISKSITKHLTVKDVDLSDPSFSEMLKCEIKNAKELGTDLLEADYPEPASELEAIYRGRIYSISGSDARFPKLPRKELRETRINLYPFLYGISQPLYCPNGQEIIFSNRPLIDERSDSEKEEYEKIILDILKKENTKREYLWLTENLPSIAPKTLSGYSRMKNLNSANFQKLRCAAHNMGYELAILKPESPSQRTYSPEEILHTKWGTYEMPDPYVVDISRGPRNNLKKIN